MSAFFPPDYYFNNIQFNSAYYQQEDTGLTISEGDQRYLKFPTAQAGEETLQDINVNGTANFDGAIASNSFISFKDNLTPFTNTTTAYKSGNNLVLQGQDNNSGLAVINKDNAGNNVTSMTCDAVDTIFTTNVKANLYTNRMGSMSIGPVTNNTLNIIQGGITASNVRIAISASDVLVGKPITSNSTIGGERSVKTSYLQLTDVASTTTLNNDFQMYHSGPQTFFQILILMVF